MQASKQTRFANAFGITKQTKKARFANAFGITKKTRQQRKKQVALPKPLPKQQTHTTTANTPIQWSFFVTQPEWAI